MIRVLPGAKGQGHSQQVGQQVNTRSQSLEMEMHHVHESTGLFRGQHCCLVATLCLILLQPHGL